MLYVKNVARGQYNLHMDDVYYAQALYMPLQGDDVCLLRWLQVDLHSYGRLE